MQRQFITRFWSGALLALIFSSFPILAATFGDFEYTDNGAAVTITGYTGSGGSVTIPTTINGLPVTVLGDSSFRGKSAITSIVIPNGVTTLAVNSLRECSGLTSINLPASLTSIGAAALRSCTGLTNVSIPANVDTIGVGAFFLCSGLTSVNMTDGADLAIQSFAFAQCSNLTGVIMSDTVTEVRQQAFQSCTKLTNIRFSAGLQSIGQFAFTDCDALTTVSIQGDGLVIGSTAFAFCDELTDVAILSSTQSIGDFAFADCPKLESATIAATVTSIGESAFQNNPVFAEITFEGDAPTLGSNVFFNTDPGLTVYFAFESGGFTSPTWRGFPAFSPPVFTQNLASSLEVDSGSTATFTVAAKGISTPTFQWYSGSSGNISNPIAGATGASYTTPPITSAVSYWVRASNNSGVAADSNTVSVTVKIVVPSPPSITTQPLGPTISSGSTAMLSVTATGTNLSYQWYLGARGDTSQPISGATSSSFTTPALSTTASFWVNVSGEGGSVNSSTAVVLVNAASANLSGISIDPGTLSPGFNSLKLDYTSSVPASTASLRVTASAVDAGASITINGANVASGAQSSPISLVTGSNPISIKVTSSDPAISKTYTINVSRPRAISETLATNDATNVTSDSAILQATLAPNGSAEVRFEYGTSTAYGSSTAVQIITGTGSVSIQAPITGLPGGREFHYRIVVLNGDNPVYGEDSTFTTLPPRIFVVTENTIVKGPTTARLVGSVFTRGLEVQVHFDYGTTTQYGSSTPPKIIPAGNGVENVFEEISGLTANTSYHVRLVASTVMGNDVTFRTVDDPDQGFGDGTPSGPPVVTTSSSTSVSTRSATFTGTVNSNGGSTTVYFEFSTLPFSSSPPFTRKSPVRTVGNSPANAKVSIFTGGLAPGTAYFFRIVAINSLGESVGAERSFVTDHDLPDVEDKDTAANTPADAMSLAGVNAISTTVVRVSGNVRASSAETTVEVLWGTDRELLSNTTAATPGTVTGVSSTRVTADLENLRQGVTYYYQFKALNSGGVGLSAIRSFSVATLSGRLQDRPPEVSDDARQASLSVNLIPSAIGAGWRLAGEQIWRLPGETVSGLTSGNRIIEYRPVAGHIQPASETVALVSGAPAVDLAREYIASPMAGSGGLTVNLKPSSLADPSRPIVARLQWRLIGETDTDWKDGGTTVSGLPTGKHVVECKPVAGRSTPPPASVDITNSETTELTLTYYEADPETGTPPEPLSFTKVSDTSLPYTYVGQIRSDVGSSTGFVARPRVVVTAAHVVFDDGTLASATGLQWLYQRHSGIHEPAPQIPRAFFTLTGYAAQRIADDSPGVSTPDSQHLDAAAMFFNTEAGRGGFSGYLASDLDNNEFLLSSKLKTLVGYPVENVPDANRNKMHATQPTKINFTRPPGSTRTFTTQDIYSTGGSSGAPLCVLDEDGSFYPAGIYLGGTGQTVVRAIDSEVANLIGFAEISADGTTDDGEGSITGSDSESNDTPALGSLRVIIEPAAARYAGAGWRIQTGSYLASGAQVDELDPNTYNIGLTSVSGYKAPSSPSVEILGGELKTVTFSYTLIPQAPRITSPADVTVNKGEVLLYEITASNSPTMFTLSGLLPMGTVFDSSTGRVTGTTQEAGKFPVVVGASSTGGADSKEVEIISLPLISPQTTGGPFLQPLSYQIDSSESGTGVSYSASNLPPGMALDASTGRVSGTPTVPGTFVSPVNVSINGASQSSTVTFTISGTAPEDPLPPVTDLTVGYGEHATLEITPSGLPTPTVQWFSGESGDDSQPVVGATESTFVTPPLTSTAKYWARLTNLSGSVDSPTFTVSVLPSSNANLSFLSLSSAAINPNFIPGRTSYTATVPNSITQLGITPSPADPVSTITVNGTASPNNAVSSPIQLVEGANTVTVRVTAQDGVTTKDYTVVITRSSTPVLTTLGADGINDISATIRGSVTPNGPGTVFFEYGPTTAYGSRAGSQTVSGTSALAVNASLTGLTGNTTYHYRIGFNDGGTTVFGGDMSFTTGAPRPVAVTGNAGGINATGATLIGIVNPRGTRTDVYFEYGTAPNQLGTSTAVQDIGSGTRIVEVIAGVSGLTTGTTYYYRTVAMSAAFAQPVFGEIVQFIPQDPPIGEEVSDGLADDAPLVVAGSENASGIEKQDAVLEAIVNPNDGTTFVYYEYGTSTDYGFESIPFSIGNGVEDSLVISAIGNLEPGQTYYYRILAENAKGLTTGAGNSFETEFDGPGVTTGEASAISTRSARLNGLISPNGTARDVYFRYGTDGVTFPMSVRAFQQTVDGPGQTTVHVDLIDLEENQTYFYKLVATESGEYVGTEGEVLSFNPSVLVGLVSQEPRGIPASNRQGEVTVNLLPAGTGSWRFRGEQKWRASGETATGLATGDRTVEFRPIRDAIQPGSELITLAAGDPPLVIERLYYEAVIAGSGTLQVNLLPSLLSDENVPQSFRSQWRLAGDTDQTWKNSGQQITGLPAGTYLIESKPIFGWDTPVATRVTISEGLASNTTIAYFEAASLTENPPQPLTFETVTTNPDLAYAHVGQIRSGSGSHSGFVVKPRVVATVARAVFDEATLTTVTGINWLLQLDEGIHEPKPLTPRGTYFFTGYDAQRISENTPGDLSIASLDRNVAALYFLEDAGRGGFSGFLGSDKTDNEFLVSSNPKILAGYPVGQGQMHATPPDSEPFAFIEGKTFSSTSIRGQGGMAGGPLCVQYAGGAYYPAGIYLGGTTVGFVRAIDSAVVDLLTRAEVSGNGGDNNTGGGITQTSVVGVLNANQPGSLKVTIEPASAVALGAAWQLVPESSFRPGGAQKSALSAGKYNLRFATVPGFTAPAMQTVTVTGGQLTTVTFSYQDDSNPGGNSPLEDWRLANFQTSENTGDAADDQDPDKDGAKNIDEFIAGTNPKDSNDIFRPASVTKTGNTFTMTAAGKIGRVYNLQRNTSLEGAWTTVASQGPLATASTVSLSDTATPIGSAFYRIEVTYPSGFTPGGNTALENWRQSNFGTTANTGDAADTEDPDKDGVTNIAEFTAGTDPNSSADFFQLTNPTKSGNTFTVGCAGKTGRIYTLQRNTGLSGIWSNVTSQGPLASDAPVSLTDPSAPAGTSFYRIEVSMP